MGSCLTLRNELSEEAHVLTEQETVLGRGAGGEQEGKGARGTARPRAHHRGFYGDEISSRVVCGQSF